MSVVVMGIGREKGKEMVVVLIAIVAIMMRWWY